MKSALARLGIRGFKPQLRKAPQLAEALRTPEDVPIPPNTLAEIRRDYARLAILREQIKELEQARLRHLEDTPQGSPNAMVRLLAGVVGLGVETAYLLVQEVFRGTYATAGPSLAMPGSPVRRTKANQSGAKRACPRQAMPACVVA
jgi:hypothetical protein